MKAERQRKGLEFSRLLGAVREEVESELGAARQATW